MEEQTKDIRGIVFLSVKLEDFDRVEKQLHEMMQTGTIVYKGILNPVHPMRDGQPVDVLFYLELMPGEWGNIVYWCSFALRVGLIQEYRYAETGPMTIVSQQSAKE